MTEILFVQRRAEERTSRPKRLAFRTEEIIAALGSEKGDSRQVELAELLGRLTGRGLSDRSILFYFRRAADAEDRLFCDELNKRLNRYDAVASASVGLTRRAASSPMAWCSRAAQSRTACNLNYPSRGKANRP
jgi:hypothetical protein